MGGGGGVNYRHFIQLAISYSLSISNGPRTEPLDLLIYLRQNTRMETKCCKFTIKSCLLT